MESPKLLWNASDAKVPPVDVHAGVVHYCTVTFSVSWCQALKQFNKTLLTDQTVSVAMSVLGMFPSNESHGFGFC